MQPVASKREREEPAGGSSPSDRQAKHLRRIMMIHGHLAAGEAEDEDPTEYFEEAMPSDEVDALDEHLRGQRKTARTRSRSRPR